jgi:hypothetical protein
LDRSVGTEIYGARVFGDHDTRSCAAETKSGVRCSVAEFRGSRNRKPNRVFPYRVRGFSAVVVFVMTMKMMRIVMMIHKHSSFPYLSLLYAIVSVYMFIQRAPNKAGGHQLDPVRSPPGLAAPARGVDWGSRPAAQQPVRHPH